MTDSPTIVVPGAQAQGASNALLSLLAFASGALIANLYYAQPLLASIAPEIHVSRDLAGSIVSVTQIGYGVGLFLVVPLSDLVENRILALATIALATLGLIGMALSESITPFFISAFVIGVFSTAAQVLLPFASHMIPEARRGRVMGNIMAGVLTGIMAARPIALFIGGSFGWRTVFWFAAAIMILIGIALWRTMPQRKPRGGMHYGQVLASMIRIFARSPILRQRAIYQSLMFGAFTMFWTAAPLMLADRFGLSQQAIGLFALAGMGGAFAAPITGRLADRGFSRATTVCTMVLAGVSFYATGWMAAWGALIPLAIFTILLDGAVQGNQIVSQRILFTASAEMRGRINGIYTTVQFIGGGLGAVIGTVSYHAGGWMLTSICGGLAGVAMLILFATELVRRLPYRIADM